MSKEKKPKVVPNSDVPLADYAETLADIKRQIEEARIKAITSASTVMVRLYWNVGKKIVEKQESSGWGTNVIEKLAKDIQSAFPPYKGFSRANLFHMRSFYLAYSKSLDPTRQIDSLPFFSLPWWHNVFNKLTPAVEIGWRLAFNYWGKGYATEGAKAALRYGFEKLNLPEIVSFTAVQNNRSRHVMEKIGMHRNEVDDFDHPKLSEGHPLKRHVLYRLKSDE